jgi:hypothetical protein
MIKMLGLKEGDNRVNSLDIATIGVHLERPKRIPKNASVIFSSVNSIAKTPDFADNLRKHHGIAHLRY